MPLLGRKPEPASEPEPALPPLSEPEAVEAWRLVVLLRAGYQFENAEQLAASPADLHAATDLLEAGCPEHVALNILL